MFRSLESGFLWRHLVFGFEMIGQVRVSDEAFPCNAARTHVYWTEEATTRSMFLLLVSSQVTFSLIAGVAVRHGTQVGVYCGMFRELLVQVIVVRELRSLAVRV